jgi:hypothetical protein
MIAFLVIGAERGRASEKSLRLFVRLQQFFVMRGTEAVEIYAV